MMLLHYYCFPHFRQILYAHTAYQKHLSGSQLIGEHSGYQSVKEESIVISILFLTLLLSPLGSCSQFKCVPWGSTNAEGCANRLSLKWDFVFISFFFCEKQTLKINDFPHLWATKTETRESHTINFTSGKDATFEIEY